MSGDICRAQGSDVSPPGLFSRNPGRPVGEAGSDAPWWWYSRAVHHLYWPVTRNAFHPLKQFPERNKCVWPLSCFQHSRWMVSTLLGKSLGHIYEGLSEDRSPQTLGPCAWDAIWKGVRDLQLSPTVPLFPLNSSLMYLVISDPSPIPQLITLTHESGIHVPGFLQAPPLHAP